MAKVSVLLTPIRQVQVSPGHRRITTLFGLVDLRYSMLSLERLTDSELSEAWPLHWYLLRLKITISLK